MKSEKIHPIYVIAGKDRYLAHTICHQLQEQLLGKDHALGLSTYEGKSVDVATVLDELRTLPFLAERRVVVVDEADKFISENRPLLEKYFDQPSPSGVLIFTCETWRSNTRLAKILSKIGKLLPAEPFKGKALRNWVTQCVKDFNKAMPLNAADALIEIVGTDAGRLANEIEKLALYCGSRKTIAVEDIEQLCGPTAERSVFLMNDLIAEGKTDQALQTLETLLRTDRSAEYTMVGVLAFSLRRLLKARSLADAGYNESQILQACGIYPGLAERFLGQFRRFTVAKLRKLLNELTETDLASKTGLGDVKLNLEKFIVCACTG